MINTNLTTRIPQTTSGKRATTKGATGPKPMDSAVTLEMMPAKMAIIPFQKVVIEKVIPIHSEGNPCRSECSYTYLWIIPQCFIFDSFYKTVQLTTTQM